jgi:hypothetical protein
MKEDFAMTQRSATIVRSLASTAVLSIGIIGLPALAGPTSAAASFVSSVLVAPVAASAGAATIGSPDAAADRFVSTVLARRAGSVAAPVSTTAATGTADATESFVQRVLVPRSAV